jgi:glycosyltransferase involved in cell wall biosynthesis
VIDDGSTDKTVQLASKYRVKIIQHGENKGLAAARNTAIKHAAADFVASVDADCLPKADWLVHLMKQFKSTKVAAAGGRLLEKHAHNACDRWRAVHMKQHWGPTQTIPAFLYGSNSVFRKKALVNIGLYNEKFRTNYEDVDICSRLKRKGWMLAYEPRAVAHHLKQDNISSILDTYWRWNLAYYKSRKFYGSTDTFVFKIKDNLGLANRYLEEDQAAGEHRLLYLDFLLAFHHSLRDFEYFISQRSSRYPRYEPVALWLSLIDLTFFYHLQGDKENISTVIPKKNAFVQNFLALNLLANQFIWAKFKNEHFRKVFYKDLLVSVYTINDETLVDTLVNLVTLHGAWDDLAKKRHPNLDPAFLNTLLTSFQEWLGQWVHRFPKFVNLIESSAKQMEILPS